MPNLRHAAELLRAANSAGGKRALALELGFTAEPLVVDHATRRRLCLPVDAGDITITKGRGALRALSFEADSGADLRTLMSQVATSLASTTSHVLWLIIGSQATTGQVGIACWLSASRGIKIVALVAERERIVASDAEVVVALGASSQGDDLLVHTRWRELLGREALSRRFYRVLEQRVRALADSLSLPSAGDRHELALLYVSRILFLSFLEAKGWLAGDRAFLSHQFDGCMATGGRFQQRVLLPLFFGTLNTPIANRSAVARQFGSIPFLNGGLFSKNALERRHSAARFSDAAFGSVFSDLLSAYRFTAREGQEEWMEAAIDPEMLGRAFESLMASRERRVSGAFYTPSDMVSHLTARALIVALADGVLTGDDITAALTGTQLESGKAILLRARLKRFTVLDPACGSGAFLVHVLERVADLHRTVGDPRSLSAIRRDVLARTIHGVDLNPTAVWLCELRLWLSVVIENDETRMSAVPPLPNLDASIRVGDTLSGEGFTQPPAIVGPSAVLTQLRNRYVRATGPSKAPLRKALAREERQRAIAAIDRELTALSARRREQLEARRAPNLFGDRTKPNADERSAMRVNRLRAAELRKHRRRITDGGALSFSFPSHFGTAHSQAGFDLVIGNPPWVRLHNIPPASRALLRATYTVYQHAAWEHGAQGGHASRGFASQIDLSALFVERSVDLMSPTGCIALLLPAKLWRSLAGGGVRALLSDRVTLREIDDWSDAPSSFDAAVYPSLMIASRSRHECQKATGRVRRRNLQIEWQQDTESLRLYPSDPASPWLILPPEVRRAFDRIATRGQPLSASIFGRAMLGVKCGCNDAFIIETGEASGHHVTVKHRGRTGQIERTLIRPLLRGDAVSPWRVNPSRSAIVWTHDASGEPMRALPTGAARWLGPWKRQLNDRTDLHGNTKWWSLFRTESADSRLTRVVWSDFGRTPKAAVIEAGDQTVALNSCYVLPCQSSRDAFAFAALMNSPVAAAWLNAIAEPARGGWHRYLAWTVALLPLPRDWERACDVLAPMTERALAGTEPTADELSAAVCSAYRVRACDIAPLIAWCHTE